MLINPSRSTRSTAWLDRWLLEWGYTDGSGPVVEVGGLAVAAPGARGVASGDPYGAHRRGPMDAGRYGTGPVSAPLVQAADGEGFYSRRPAPTQESQSPRRTPTRRPSRPRPGVMMGGDAALNAALSGMDRGENMMGGFCMEMPGEDPDLLLEG